MTTSRPMKISSRRQTSDSSGGGGSGGRWWQWRSGGGRDEICIRRKAWYLKSFLCCDMTEDNMEMMRKMLSVCRAVKTELKLTPSTWSAGKRGRSHRIKRVKLPLSAIQSIEQDEILVNVLLCVLEMDNLPNGIRYEVAAYKFHDPADARTLAETFQQWTNTAPMPKAPSIVNGSVLVRSQVGGSMHSLVMPGRPTNGSLAPERWQTIDRSGPRRYVSMGDLTASSEVFYPPSGYRVVQRNRTIHNGAGANGSAVGGHRYRLTPEQQTMTSDEGNGSLSFSDHQQRNVMCRDVETSIQEPVGSHLQQVFNYQRYRPYPQNQTSVADVACQVVIPDGVDLNRRDTPSYGSSSNNGIAAVITNGAGSVTGATRVTRSSGIGRDFDDDERSTVSAVSLSTYYDEEPGLSTRYRTPNGSTSMQNGGIAVAYVNGGGEPRRAYGGAYDELDSAQHTAIPGMTTTVRRIYRRPSYGDSRQDMDFEPRRSRYQSYSNEFLEVPNAVVRSRSAGPQYRYARSDLGVGYQSNNGPVVVVDNSDAMSVVSTASARQLLQSSTLINPNFRKAYVTRQGTSGGSIYLQAPRPHRPSTGSGYGGVRSRAMSHRQH